MMHVAGVDTEGSWVDQRISGDGGDDDAMNQ